MSFSWPFVVNKHEYTRVLVACAHTFWLYSLLSVEHPEACRGPSWQNRAVAEWVDLG